MRVLQLFDSVVVFELLLLITSCCTANYFTHSLEGIAPRVVGGEGAKIGELPHQLSLRYYGQHICGATLIEAPYFTHGDVALTAAHCFDHVGRGKQHSPGAFTVMGGFVSMTKASNTPTAQIVEVQQIVIHRQYNRYYSHNDIAILILSSSFNITEAIKPASLPSQNEVIKDRIVVSGWGATHEGGGISEVLLSTKVPVVDNYRCAAQYSEVYGNNQIISSKLCAGYESGGKDTCQYDSGGPGVIIGSKKIILHAITSWGEGCARPGFPGVYTRVASYVSWVKGNLYFLSVTR